MWMARSTLPQSYKLSDGILTPDLTTKVGWTGSGNVALTNDTENFKTGAASVKLAITSAGGNGQILKDPFGVPPLHFGDVSFWYYVYGDPATTVASVSLSLFSTYATAYVYISIAGSAMVSGWNYYSGKVQTWGTVGGATWTNTFTAIRFKVTAAAGQTCAVSFSQCYFEAEYIPLVMWTFDDTYSAPHDAGFFQYLADKNQYATLYVSKNRIGANDAIYLTHDELDEIYAMGHGIGSHGTDHHDLTTMTRAAVAAELTENSEYLVSQGWPRCAYHVGYPYGSRNATVDLAMADAGQLTGRGVTTGSIRSGVFGGVVGDYTLPCVFGLGPNLTLEVAKAAIWTAKLAREHVIIMAHQILAEPDLEEGNDWSTSDAQALADFIQSIQLHSVSMDAYFIGRTNPRYQSLPVGRSPL